MNELTKILVDLDKKMHCAQSKRDACMCKYGESKDNRLYEEARWYDGRRTAYRDAIGVIIDAIKAAISDEK